MTGVFINYYFVGVTADDLSNYYILVYISIAFGFYQLLLIQLIPTMDEIKTTIDLR